MAYIKKLVMHGFKSFARKTEIPFDNGINVIIGPNGSGKSNISDAICFALGRLSIKSMRAEKAKNLIFMGSKYVKPAKEAVVELVFDNEDKAFNLPTKEVSLKRIVKIKGQSVYKINDETKTRSEVVETLAQAGIDPYGYNMILQGQIQSIVRMHGEERRKIIGEVAGISVYEWRKEKSIKELDKTESRLKEISTILRERTAQLNNLERERSQAKRFKELELTAKRCKATITKKRLDEKEKEINQISKAIDEKLEHKSKKQIKLDETQKTIETLSEKNNQINKKIKDATGLEQSTLREQITNLRAELEGLKVRHEGHEHRKEELENRIEQMKNSIPESEREIAELRKESPLIAKRTEELKRKKAELAELEKERKSLLSVKSDLNSLRERIQDKRNQLTKANRDGEILIKQIEESAPNLQTKNEDEAKSQIEKFTKQLTESQEKIESLRADQIENEKTITLARSEISRMSEIKKKVNELDICPLCQSNITKEHISHVFEDCNTKIDQAEKDQSASTAELDEIKTKLQETKNKIQELESKIKTTEREFSIHKTIHDKKEMIKRSTNYAEKLKTEITELEKKKSSLEKKSQDFSNIDDKYKDILLEIEEISSRTEQNVDTTLMYKERELEKTKNVIERAKQDLEEIEDQITDLADQIKENSTNLEEKETKEEELNARFKKMFQERDATHNEIQQLNLKANNVQSEIRQIEDQINYLKVGRSKIDGEKQVIEMDLQEFKSVELIQGSIQTLEERLKKTQETLNNIGSINLRALEVYDEIKKEYDNVKEKADTIQKEKDQIMKIIEEIDKKKRKVFMKTFKAINSLFTENFSRLSSKGTAYLEVETPDDNNDVSNSEVNIVVKMAKGKYFDVHSLSGGEQTLVALSLLFAIQEYKPYHYYILDEIDAALDKRNSERLAGLLQQYTKAGQYIVVTHNDAIILDSDVLYGVSMHEGVSKILSLKVN